MAHAGLVSRFWALLALALAALPAAPAGAQSPRVVASILPIQSLVAGVMDGVGVPETIVRAGASPHAYSLRPSEARALSQARVVFWIGESYEAFLKKPLAALAGKAEIVTLEDAPGIEALRARAGGAWDAHDDHGHAHGGHKRDETDGHLFLHPGNARAIALAAAAALAKVDPANGSRYQANATRVVERLAALEGEMRLMTEPVRGRPFVVFHDAYQYLERSFDLAAVGSITVSPERPPGAQRLRQLRRKILDLKAECVFAEPQFQPALVRTVTEGTPARTGVLDPLGASLKPGPDAYFQLMRGLARSLADCLGG